MLSKSQARLFFLSMTGAFSAVFLWLTVDTIRQVPRRSHEEEISPEVVRGKEIWEANNCMGCHTIFGEGAYYAPELTKVVDRRGPAWIKTFLKDPAAMYPGKRQMVKYDFTEAQIDDLVAFFTWVGKVDTNGFPRAPDLVPTAQAAVVPESVMAAAPERIGSTCKACHSIGGAGGNVGPPLQGLSRKYSRDQLDAWLRDPPSVKPGTAMPNLQIPDAERAQLVDWLLTLP